MSHYLKIRIGIIFLFVLLIFIHLLPLSLHPFDALNDTKDCVLNTWIPGWIQQQLFKDPLNLFNTNTFYPHTNTLSYSEHLFPQALISLPVKLLTNNPLEPIQNIYGEGDKIKYLKIIHIGDDKGSLWSVAEMEVSVIY